MNNGSNSANNSDEAKISEEVFVDILCSRWVDSELFWKPTRCILFERGVVIWTENLYQQSYCHILSDALKSTLSRTIFSPDVPQSPSLLLSLGLSNKTSKSQPTDFTTQTDGGVGDGVMNPSGYSNGHISLLEKLCKIDVEESSIRKYMKSNSSEWPDMIWNRVMSMTDGKNTVILRTSTVEGRDALAKIINKVHLELLNNAAFARNASLRRSKTLITASDVKTVEEGHRMTSGDVVPKVATQPFSLSRSSNTADSPQLSASNIVDADGESLCLGETLAPLRDDATLGQRRRHRFSTHMLPVNPVIPNPFPPSVQEGEESLVFSPSSPPGAKISQVTQVYNEALSRSQLVSQESHAPTSVQSPPQSHPSVPTVEMLEYEETALLLESTSAATAQSLDRRSLRLHPALLYELRRMRAHPARAAENPTHTFALLLSAARAMDQLAHHQSVSASVEYDDDGVVEDSHSRSFRKPKKQVKSASKDRRSEKRTSQGRPRSNTGMTGIVSDSSDSDTMDDQFGSSASEASYSDDAFENEQYISPPRPRARSRTAGPTTSQQERIVAENGSSSETDESPQWGPLRLPTRAEFGPLRRRHWTALVPRYLPLLCDGTTAGDLYDALVEDTQPVRVRTWRVMDAAGRVRADSTTSLYASSGRIMRGAHSVSPEPTQQHHSHVHQTEDGDVLRLEWDEHLERLLRFDRFERYLKALQRVLTAPPREWMALREALQLDPCEMLVMMENGVQTILRVDAAVAAPKSTIEGLMASMVTSETEKWASPSSFPSKSQTKTDSKKAAVSSSETKSNTRKVLDFEETFGSNNLSVSSTSTDFKENVVMDEVLIHCMPVPSLPLQMNIPAGTIPSPVPEVLYSELMNSKNSDGSIDPRLKSKNLVEFAMMMEQRDIAETRRKYYDSDEIEVSDVEGNAPVEKKHSINRESSSTTTTSNVSGSHSSDVSNPLLTPRRPARSQSISTPSMRKNSLSAIEIDTSLAPVPSVSHHKSKRSLLVAEFSSPSLTSSITPLKKSQSVSASSFHSSITNESNEDSVPKTTSSSRAHLNSHMNVPGIPEFSYSTAHNVSKRNFNISQGLPSGNSTLLNIDSSDLNLDFETSLGSSPSSGSPSPIRPRAKSLSSPSMQKLSKSKERKQSEVLSWTSPGVSVSSKGSSDPKRAGYGASKRPEVSIELQRDFFLQEKRSTDSSSSSPSSDTESDSGDSAEQDNLNDSLNNDIGLILGERGHGINGSDGMELKKKSPSTVQKFIKSFTSKSAQKSIFGRWWEPNNPEFQATMQALTLGAISGGQDQRYSSGGYGYGYSSYSPLLGPALLATQLALPSPFCPAVYSRIVAAHASKTFNVRGSMFRSIPATAALFLQSRAAGTNFSQNTGVASGGSNNTGQNNANTGARFSLPPSFPRLVPLDGPASLLHPTGRALAACGATEYRFQGQLFLTSKNLYLPASKNEVLVVPLASIRAILSGLPTGNPSLPSVPSNISNSASSGNSVNSNGNFGTDYYWTPSGIAGLPSSALASVLGSAAGLLRGTKNGRALDAAIASFESHISPPTNPPATTTVTSENNPTISVSTSTPSSLAAATAAPSVPGLSTGNIANSADHMTTGLAAAAALQNSAIDCSIFIPHCQVRRVVLDPQAEQDSRAHCQPLSPVMSIFVVAEGIRGASVPLLAAMDKSRDYLAQNNAGVLESKEFDSSKASNPSKVVSKGKEVSSRGGIVSTLLSTFSFSSSKNVSSSDSTSSASPELTHGIVTPRATLTLTFPRGLEILRATNTTVDPKLRRDALLQALTELVASHRLTAHFDSLLTRVVADRLDTGAQVLLGTPSSTNSKSEQCLDGTTSVPSKKTKKSKNSGVLGLLTSITHTLGVMSTLVDPPTTTQNLRNERDLPLRLPPHLVDSMLLNASLSTLSRLPWTEPVLRTLLMKPPRTRMLQRTRISLLAAASIVRARAVVRARTRAQVLSGRLAPLPPLGGSLQRLLMCSPADPLIQAPGTSIASNNSSNFGDNFGVGQIAARAVLRRFALLAPPREQLLAFEALAGAKSVSISRLERRALFDRRTLTRELQTLLENFFYPLNSVRRGLQYVYAWESPPLSLFFALLSLFYLWAGLSDYSHVLLFFSHALFALALGSISPAARRGLWGLLWRPKSSNSANSSANRGAILDKIRAFRSTLDLNQLRIIRFNRKLLRIRGLYTWTDPRRSAIFVAVLATAGFICAVVPWRVLSLLLWAMFFSAPLRKPGKGVIRLAFDRFWEGIPIDSQSNAVYGDLCECGAMAAVDAVADPAAAASFDGSLCRSCAAVMRQSVVFRETYRSDIHIIK